MNTNNTEKLLAGYFFFLLLLCMSLLMYLSEGSYGGSDNYIHYRFARYAFDHPDFFLNHWAKPLYTLLSAPFAQLGYNGARMFNVLLSVLSGFLCYRTAQGLGYRNSLLSTFFACFSPIYFVMVFTAMTEILFGFVLILAVYFFVKNRFHLSAIVISFLPLARTEGIVILPAFLIALIYYRRFLSAGLLTTGFFVYSTCGYFHFQDFFWLIHQNPYTGAKEIYGSGELLFFAKSAEDIFGKSITAFILIGSSVVSYRMWFTGMPEFIRENDQRYLTLKKNTPNRAEVLAFLLLFIPALSYFSFHSFLWWRGLGGSLGLIRVMAGIVPLTALLALRGWNTLDKLVNRFKPFHWIFLVATIVVVMRVPFKQHRLPLSLDPVESLVKNTAEWLKSGPYSAKKIYYYDPLLCHFLEINPFDPARMQERVPNSAQPEEHIGVGDLVVWDAHFGPNEGRLPLEKLQKNPYYKELKAFTPAQPFTVLGGYTYTIHVFQRTHYNLINQASGLLAELNFESVPTGKDSAYYTTNPVLHGARSLLLNAQNEFSPGFSVKWKDLNYLNPAKISASIAFHFPKDQKDCPASLIVAMERNGTTYNYKALDFDQLSGAIPGEWNHAGIEVPVPPDIQPEDDIKVYVWNREKKNLIVDDLRVRILY